MICATFFLIIFRGASSVVAFVTVVASVASVAVAGAGF
jgi:hypothetical protein